MKLRILQIDSFTSQVFRGNPAGVCPLNAWLDDQTLQNIATEMNLSETAFFVGSNGRYEIRWFTPTVEVDLCGHATLAAGWVLANELGEKADIIQFASRSGELRVHQRRGRLMLDFPIELPTACEIPGALIPALGASDPVEVLGGSDYLVVLRTESEVQDLSPQFAELFGLPRRGVIVTAPGDSVDFVSRWFGPNVGVPEDPVTGSAHTMLTPYWSAKLNKRVLTARQISSRGGELECEIQGERVYITGDAVKFLDGTLELPDSLGGID